MFSSDKDLKKVAPRVAKPKAAAKEAHDVSLLDKVRQDREERNKLNELRLVTVKVQAWWRQKYQKLRLVRYERSDFDKKLGDIKNLTALLQKKKVDFVAPPGVVLDMCNKLFFWKHHVDSIEENKRRVSLCKYVLLPSLCELDPSKNVITLLASKPILCNTLIRQIIRLLRLSQRSIDISDITCFVLPCLRHLLGLGAPFRMQYHSSLLNAFDTTRRRLSPLFLQEIREYFIFRASQLFMDAYDENALQYSLTCVDENTPECRAIDILLSLISCEPSLLSNFVTHILSAPMVTQLLSQAMLRKIVSLSEFTSIMACSVDLWNTLLPSPFAGLSSGQWLLGNICTFAPYLPFDGENALSNDSLIVYLRSVCVLLAKFPVSGVLHGKSGVIWNRDRPTQLTAAAIPKALQLQILHVIDPTFLRGLYRSVFKPIVLDVVEDKDDIKEIRDAMTSTVLKMTRDVVAEQQESWFSSRWAKKLISSVSNFQMFSSKKDEQTESNTTRQMSCPPANIPLLRAACELWAITFPPASCAAIDSIPWKSLSSFCFSDNIVISLWYVCLAFKINRENLTEEHIFCGSNCDALVVMAALFKIVCVALDDGEFYEMQRPLPLSQVLVVIRLLKNILYTSLLQDASVHGSKSSNEFVTEYRLTAFNEFTYSLVATTLQLCEALGGKGYWEYLEIRRRSNIGVGILRVMPWSIQFTERLKLFWEIVDTERLSIQGSNDPNTGDRSRGVVVKVRRQRILQDGMNALDKVGAALKDRIVVRYINDFGQEEVGIDMGGLFKDFWTDLSARVFDPNYGLFCVTAQQLLYPNPNASALFAGGEMESTYEFLGRILGKALFENLPVQPQFTHFFLGFMMGRYNFMNLINDLATLDIDLYKNLMFLKSYEGDVADLCLTFSVTDDTFGDHKEVDLIPGGRHVDVTSKNRHRYINAVAKYYLHDRIRNQAGAFFNGLYQIISPELFSMFCAPELQVLISGAICEISIDDWKRNTQYAGGYTSLDRNISRFWSVVESFSEADRSLLLKFVTSCERPPSLGFGELNPLFTVQRVESDHDARLPTASTCFNILKLPAYSSQSVLKEKLLLAIRSKSGFDLT